MPTERQYNRTPPLVPQDDESMDANVVGPKKAYYFDAEVLANPRSSTPPICEDLLRHVAIVTGNSNRQLAGDVASLLGISLHNVAVVEYASGEVNVKIQESVMGKDVYIVQSTCGNGDIDINESIMELLFLIRRLRQGNVRRITAVVPFFAYARQDRKTDLRVPISASAIACMISTMGVDRVITLDLHSGQIQGLFDKPLDNLVMVHEFARYLTEQYFAARGEVFDPSKCVVVSPDAGGVERARTLADILGISNLYTILKRRIEAGKVEWMEGAGDVTGLTAIIVDDIVDTGGTLAKACDFLKERGASNVVACISHGIMSRDCCEIVMKCSALDRLIVSDSIPQGDHVKKCSKLVVLTIAPLLAMAILQLTNQDSIAGLFQGPTDVEKVTRRAGLFKKTVIE